MPVLTAIARELIAAGLSGDELTLALERLESEANAARERVEDRAYAALERVVSQLKPVDAAAERRRAADRARKSGVIPQNSAESADEPIPSKESPPDPHKKLNPSPKETPSKEGSKKRATRIPDGYQPEVITATAMGIPEPRARRESETFVDWAKAAPGQKGVKLDWDAAWRNWCRRVADELGCSPPGEAADRQNGRIHVSRSDPRWDFLAARYKQTNQGRGPPNGSDGWYFPEEWLSQSAA